MAAVLCRIRFLIWAGAAAAAAWFAFELFSGRPAELGALPSLTAFLWAILLLGISYSFPAGPPVILPDDGVRQRIQKRIRQALFFVFGFVTLGIAGMVLFLTARAIGLALG
ncbi:MAG: hypothetical protein ACWGPN_08500 [Gammaproteobacteria bacterium]